MGWRRVVAAGLLAVGFGAIGARAETTGEVAPAASQGVADGVTEVVVAVANLRWDERPSYNRGNGWWPPRYGDNRRNWRPRAYAVRPYWYDRRGYGWHRRTPYAQWPDNRWPESRHGNLRVPRYGWPGYGQHDPYPRQWDRDGYVTGVPAWRYGYATGWARSDAWR